MIKLVLVAAVAAGGCVSQSARIYEHEQRAETYQSRGMPDAAAGERLRARREREQLSSEQSVIFARDDH